MAPHAPSPVVTLLIGRTTVRERVSAEIDRLIEILDRIDGDADFEPSLSALIPSPWTDQRAWAAGADDDREDQCEDEGAVTGDDEDDFGV